MRGGGADPRVTVAKLTFIEDEGRDTAFSLREEARRAQAARPKLTLRAASSK